MRKANAKAVGMQRIRKKMIVIEVSVLFPADPSKILFFTYSMVSHRCKSDRIARKRKELPLWLQGPKIGAGSKVHILISMFRPVIRSGNGERRCNNWDLCIRRWRTPRRRRWRNRGSRNKGMSIEILNRWSIKVYLQRERWDLKNEWNDEFKEFNVLVWGLNANLEGLRSRTKDIFTCLLHFLSFRVRVKVLFTGNFLLTAKAKKLN